MKHLVLFLLGCGLSVLIAATPALAADQPITIYIDQYPADITMSYIAKQLAKSHYNIPVQLKKASVGVAFIGVAHGQRSLFLAAWLPTTHAAYWARFKNQVLDIGTLYRGARIGWVVPAYVPKSQLNSIPDLKKPKVAAKLDQSIQGISAGSGDMVVSHKALKAYHLNYTIIDASGAAMLAALDRATQNHKWIVVVGWSPHWMWIRFHLRYLKDPKHVFGTPQHVEAIANQSFKSEAPKVYGLLTRMHYTLHQVNTMLEFANRTSYKQAAKHFIKKHPKLVSYWVTGKRS